MTASSVRGGGGSPGASPSVSTRAAGGGRHDARASTPAETRPDRGGVRTAAFDEAVDAAREMFFEGDSLIPGLGALLRRRVGGPGHERGVAVLQALAGVSIMLGSALAVTLALDQWGIVPWGRWAVVLVLYGGLEAFVGWPLSPGMRRKTQDWTALLPTMRWESDVRELTEHTRRLQRLPRRTAGGLAVAAAMLGVSVVLAPGALGQVPAGSVVLLAWLLLEFGSTPIYWGVLVNWAFITREARYDHDLFWASPADSAEVQRAMHKVGEHGLAAGWWITMSVVMAVVLVGWASPLVLPLAVGFVGVGYVAAIGAALGWRGSVRRIVERSRAERLALLRASIDGFESRITDLTPEEAERLGHLLRLHDRIRDAPASPSAAHTLSRTALALVVPTVTFVITVFGEVSAERLLDSLLP